MTREPAAAGMQSRTQRGMVLVISLVFLVIISFVALYAMRGATLDEQAARNMRASQLATVAAETAMRYCEDTTKAIASGWLTDDAFKGRIQQISDEPANPDNLDDDPTPQLPTRWKVRANWDKSGPIAITVPASELSAAGSGISSASSEAPRCMVERYQPIPEDKVSDKRVGYLVTAVGFAPGWQDGDPESPSSSEAWLQSAFFGAPINN